MLLPYATTSKWQPWKTRVFDFRSIQKESGTEFAFQKGDYRAFDPPDHVYPEHSDRIGADGFMFAFLHTADERQAEIGNLLSSHAISREPCSATDWDKVGDFIQTNIEPNLPKNSDTNSIHKLFATTAAELTLHPFWHGVLIDLAILIGKSLAEQQAQYNPVWELDHIPLTTVSASNLPVLRLQSGKQEQEEEPKSELEKALSQAVSADPEIAGDWDLWEKVVASTAKKLGVPVPAQLPDATDLFIDTVKSEGVLISPVKEMQLFFYQSLHRKYGFGPDVNSPPFSLGDIVRPGLSWSWSNHPGL